MAIKEETIRHPFRISESELKALERIFQEQGCDVKISAQCVDNMERDFANIEELISYENYREKKIAGLNIRATHSRLQSGRDLDVILIIRTKGVLDSNPYICIKIDSSEQRVTSIYLKIKECINNAKPNYWWIKEKIHYVALLVFLFVLD